MSNIIKELGSVEAGKACFGGGVGSALVPDGNPLGLHYAMFLPTLMGQVQRIITLKKNLDFSSRPLQFFVIVDMIV